MQRRTNLRNTKGVVFSIALLMMVTLLALGSVLLLMNVNASWRVERQRRTLLALNVAEAGLEKAIYELRQDFVGVSADKDWTNSVINGTTVNTGSVDGDGYFAFLPDTPFNAGTYSVRLKHVTGNLKALWIRATGSWGGISQRIQVYVNIDNISAWNNVIFAGHGAAGGLVKGNVDINGSVHLLGNGLLPTDFVVELGGTAELIGNNYSTMDSSLFAKVPALPTTTFNGETVSTLDAVLRVRNGVVGLNGSATAGQANVVGNSIKETINAVYTNNGFGGNQGVNNVHSDNGWSNTYDLGDSVAFPSLSDSYEGTTYQQYLRSHALVINNAVDLAKLASITPSSNFNYSNANGSISMNGSGQMTISGLVYVDGGGINMSGGNISYTGKGSILTTGDTTIDVHLETSGDNSFPNNLLAIMTPGSLNLGVGSQRHIMGLFYAEGTITSSKQTQIIGTMVSNYFNMGTEVPKIYQVPETMNNLPPYLIGGGVGWVLKVVAWQLI